MFSKYGNNFLFKFVDVAIWVVLNETSKLAFCKYFETDWQKQIKTSSFRKGLPAESKKKLVRIFLVALTVFCQWRARQFLYLLIPYFRLLI